MNAVCFFVAGEPQAQPRHRARALPGGKASLYLPEDHPVHAWKEAVVRALPAGAGVFRRGLPLRLELTVLLARPRRLIYRRRAMPRLPAPVKPDADNLVKAVKDALNRRLYADDAQVVEMLVRKFYCGGVEAPGAWILVEEFTWTGQ